MAPEFFNRVRANETFDICGIWRPAKGLALTVDVRNLLDTAPPFSSQDNTMQPCHDPRFTDPLRRTLYLRVSQAI